MGVSGVAPTPDLLDRAYFLTIPWCAALLHDPAYTASPTAARQANKPGSSENSAFAETLHTKATIGAYHEFLKKPAAAAAAGGFRVPELCTLLGLGAGMNGYAGICHGGIVAAILDEVMGNILNRNAQLGDATIARKHFTAYLNTAYVKPVRTPQVVLVRAWIKEVKGRKYYTEGVIVDEAGTVLSRGEALFVGVLEAKAAL